MKCQAKQKEWLETKENGKWEVSHVNDKHGLEISNYFSTRGTPCIKAEAIVDFPTGLVYNIINDPVYKKKYDGMMAEYYFHSKVATNTFTIFTRTR